MKLNAWFLLSITVAAVLAGCGGREPAVPSVSVPSPAPTPTSPRAPAPSEPNRTPATRPSATTVAVRVAIPTDDNLQWLNFWVAQGAGLFAAEGLTVETVVPPMPGAAARFMRMGRADVAVLPRPQFLQAVGQGEPLLAFANLFATDPINLVVKREVAEERGLSAERPLAERLDGMRGLRVGVAPGPPPRLRVLFESVGLDADTHIEIVIVAPERQNEAFGNGEVDALYAHTPFLEKALVDQGAVMLVNQSAGEVPELADRQFHILVTTQDYAASNADALVALTRAIYQAQQLIHADLAATAEAVRASGVGLLEPQGLETIITIYEPAIPRTPAVSAEGASKELALLPAQQTAPDLRGIDLADHVAPQFAEEALASTSSRSPRS